MLIKLGVHLVSIAFKAQWEDAREEFKSPVLHNGIVVQLAETIDLGSMQYGFKSLQC